MRSAAATRPAPTASAIEARIKLLRRKVQIARRKLAMTEDDYRALLLRVTGQASSTTCGPSHLDELLREFRRLGFRDVAPRAGKGRRPPPKEAQIRMIHGVWNEISPLVANGDESALRAFVRRQTKSPATPDGISAPEFLDSVQANKVLEGLKAWRARLRKQAA
ncbi:regulatory protein GemA [Falsiroseomonas sp.]|uniref:regulatory protein GemA n=1 Tax=Falsiroseomonas sp. TaxID=2870721 RepID=UPI0027204E98|nr:regulatory protein GemA [Falsiroseomonas sp.]MDO9499013.1 regulatory protein GemA [Falsiroseomonas sp.]